MARGGGTHAIVARRGTEVIDNFWLCQLVALRWHNLPCALKAAIGYGKRTLGALASLPCHRGRSKGLRIPAPILASEHAGDDARWCLAGCDSDHRPPALRSPLEHPDRRSVAGGGAPSPRHAPQGPHQGPIAMSRPLLNRARG
jgi:hypothetical protein